MKVVVTGGSGLLGQHVIRELQAHGHDILNLDRRPHPGGFRPTWTVDLAEPGTMFEASVGAGAIIHLAAFMAPNLTTDCATFNTNVALTYNVLKAAAELGIARVVVVSSTAAYGYIYGPASMAPDYLPADEDHPSRPIDSYGLSKVVGERIADSFAAAREIAIASLRFPGINWDPSFALMKERMKDPAGRRSGFWAYVDARDAAIACRLALEAPIKGHRVFNIAAAASSMAEPTADLIRRHYPAITTIRSKDAGNWSGIDSRRAERELGFSAAYRWEDAAPV